MATIFEKFVSELQCYLCKREVQSCSVIRVHSKNLEELGDLSFPLCIKSWQQFIETTAYNDTTTIFDYIDPDQNIDEQIKKLKDFSKNWSIEIRTLAVVDSNVNVFLVRSPSLFQKVFHEVLVKGSYGCSEYLANEVQIEMIPNIPEGTSAKDLDLTQLRLLTLAKVAQNLVNCITKKNTEAKSVVTLTLNSQSGDRTILCGPVLNEAGQKTTVKGSELFQKRETEVRLIALHRYHLRCQYTDPQWKTNFYIFGKACVRIEMLSNKPRKTMKLTLNDAQSAHKGAPFIFYNNVRAGIVLDKFETKGYPKLPALDMVDFSKLTMPEEWKLFYAFIVQYPSVIKGCVCDIEKGNLNPQNLIIFMSNLSAHFSAYYRKCKILVEPREHLLPTLYARIYLLRSMQEIYSHFMRILKIQRINQM